MSIIIPVYNTEKYLEICVNSVLSQNYLNFEIILVDDGSTDTSYSVCTILAKKDRRVRVIRKENGGLSSARNVGIYCANGHYVLFLDSDDFWKHNEVLSNIAIIARSNPDMICFGYREYVEGKGENGIGISFTEEISYRGSKNEMLKKMLTDGVYVSSACCKAVKLSIIKRFDLFFKEGITSEDIDWSARLLKCIDSTVVYPDSFYYYRQRKESIVHRIKYENLKMLSENIICCIDLGKEIPEGEFRDLYHNYVAYQYITFLKVALLCEDDYRTKTLIKKMKAYKWLLKYHLNKKVRIVYWFYRLFGFNLMYLFLKVYTKA